MLEHTRYSWGHINFGFNKKLDDEDKDMAHLKYEFVYGTFDFSQQKIIWDILYHLNPKMTFSTLKWLFSSMSMS